MVDTLRLQVAMARTLPLARRAAPLIAEWNEPRKLRFAFGCDVAVHGTIMAVVK
jgi:hypothetical protein